MARMGAAREGLSLSDYLSELVLRHATVTGIASIVLVADDDQQTDGEATDGE